MGQRNSTVIFGQRQEYLQLTGSKALINSDTGRFLVLSGSGQELASEGAITASLPLLSTVTAGFKIRVAVASNHSHSIAQNGGDMGALIRGNLTRTVAGDAGGGLSGSVTPLTGSARISLRPTPGAGSVIGNIFEIFSDGTYWYVTGVTSHRPTLV